MSQPRFELKRIGIFSAVKTLFLLGGCAGFLLGILQWAIFFVMYAGIQELSSTMDIPSSFELETLFSTLGGAGGIFFPLSGGFIGSILGILSGLILGGLYNVATRIWGGLEFEYGEVTPAQSAKVATPAPTQPGTVTPLPTARLEPPPPPPEPETPKDDDDDSSPPWRSSSMYE